MKNKKDWNLAYVINGRNAQRLYPNEALCQFVGTHGMMSNSENKNIRICEIGCGSGANLWMLAKEGLDVYGVDISTEALKVAEKHCAEKWNCDNIHFKQGTFDDIPFENEYFDYVIDIVSLQHIDIETSRKALREIRRVTKKGGLFFSYRLSDHSVMYLNGVSDDNFLDSYTLDDVTRNDFPLNHNGTMAFWSPAIVRNEYVKAGWKLKEIERYTRTYENGLFMVEYLGITAQNN